MNKSIFSLSSLLLTGFCAFAQLSSPTIPAKDFNVFLEGNARLVNNEAEGPMALGGDLTIAGSYQVSTHDAGTFYVGGVRTSMVIGGKVVYSSGGLQVNSNGYIKIGNGIGSTVWYTDPNGAHPPIRITHDCNYNSSPRILLQASDVALGVSASSNPVCQSGVIDFASAFTAMRSYANTMKDLTDNATITNSAGTPIPHSGLPSQVKITVNSGQNILNITGSDLNAMTDFIYNNAPEPTKYLVINVNAPGSFTWNVCNSGGIGLTECQYILYNFYNTTNLTIAGYGAIEGTVFAPNANIVKTANMANIEGQVIAKSFHHAGGEVHYAVYKPGITGCGTTLPTAAAFTVNGTVQCLGCNLFEFTNSSTGSSPLSYTWSFGDGSTSTATNPSKVYTATGTYNVSLIASGPGGPDTAIYAVTVAGTPSHDFTVNDSIQSLGGNSFAFTSTTPTFGNLYSWTFGDGSTSTAVNPTISYSATGTYTVTQTVTGSGGCHISSSHLVVVECDSVGGGGDGGLESQGLGDKVSRREYTRIRHSIPKHKEYAALPVLVKPSPMAAAKGTTASSPIERFIPAAPSVDLTARITSPEDLKTITSAVDVFSVDYVANNVAKAVVLGILTEGKAYNHTKSICDRFRGATLESTRFVTINGYQFIMFVLKEESGAIEHAISFAVGKSMSGGNLKLQSKWLISEYAGEDSVFNFQVWSGNPESTIALTQQLLNNLATVAPIVQTDNNMVLPPAYIATGKRVRENIDVTIRAARASNNAKVIFLRKLNEEAEEDSLIIPFNLAAGDSNHFTIPVYDGYEYEGHFYLDDTLTDDIYMADGNWSLDYDKTYTEVTTYKPNNNENRIYAEDEYPIYRNVRVNANTTDYISIYKFIKAGEEAADLTDYHSYKFFAKGQGKAEVVLIKESVTDFRSQYKTTIELDTVGKNYQISFDDFTSDKLSEPFDPKDVKAVVYNFEYYGVATEFSFYADEQSFSPTVVNSIKALSSKKVTIFPNPSSGKFQLSFVCEADRDMDITFTDISGRQVYKQAVHAITGANTVDVQLPAVTFPEGMLLVRMGNDNVHYNISKVSVLK